MVFLFWGCQSAGNNLRVLSDRLEEVCDGGIFLLCKMLAFPLSIFREVQCWKQKRAKASYVITVLIDWTQPHLWQNGVMWAQSIFLRTKSTSNRTGPRYANSKFQYDETRRHDHGDNYTSETDPPPSHTHLVHFGESSRQRTIKTGNFQGSVIFSADFLSRFCFPPKVNRFVGLIPTTILISNFCFFELIENGLLNKKDSCFDFTRLITTTTSLSCSS